MKSNISKQNNQAEAIPPSFLSPAGLLKAEHKKQRYRNIWMVPFGFLAILALWISVLMRNLTPSDLTHGYQWVFYQLSMMNAIFMPVMLAVIASRLCDMEIKGSTFKLLYTLEQPGHFYDFKFLAEVKYLLYFSFGQVISILLIGKVFHFTEPVQILPFIEHFLAVSCIGAVLLSFQHLLSLMSENQIVPLCVGLAGSFLGLFSMFFPRAVNQLIIWGYFSIFSVSGIDWASMEDGADYFSYLQYLNFPFPGFMLFLAVGIILYLIEKEIFKRKEV